MSRALSDLHSQAMRKFAGIAAELTRHGALYLVTYTYRSNADQLALWNQGRTVMGPNPSPDHPLGHIVTKARPGESFHNCRRAVDIAILRPDGHLDWRWMDSAACAPIWAMYGAIAKQCGMTWGGSWKTMRDLPHVEDRWCEVHQESRDDAEHFDESGNCKDLVEG